MDPLSAIWGFLVQANALENQFTTILSMRAEGLEQVKAFRARMAESNWSAFCQFTAMPIHHNPDGTWTAIDRVPDMEANWGAKPPK